MRYPEMVKTNARHRGPMESVKQSSQIRDAGRSVALLQELFTKLESKQKTLTGDIFTFYNATIPDAVQEAIHDVNTVKGGEL